PGFSKKQFRERPFGKETFPGPGPVCLLSSFANLKTKRRTHMPLTDKYGRTITDLRISITDRCNYKCVYCRTGTSGAVYSELRFDEYLRMASLFVDLGIT